MPKPYIKLIESSQKENKALVFFNGYRMAEKNKSKLWCQYLRQAGWRGSIYQFWWDGGDEDEIDDFPHIPIVDHYSHWKINFKYAKEIGKNFVCDLLGSIPETQISLIGYSLGCRVIYYGVREFNSQYSLKYIDNIILIAGAVKHIKWGSVAQNISGNIYNIYNKDDEILNEKYMIYDIDPVAPSYEPCGICPIKSKYSNLININITKLINTDSHSLKKYLKILSQVNIFTN